jgi:hypothetical protein
MERYHLYVEYPFSWVTDAMISTTLGYRNRVSSGTDLVTGLRDRHYEFKTKSAALDAMERAMLASPLVSATVLKHGGGVIASGPLPWQ